MLQNLKKKSLPEMIILMMLAIFFATSTMLEFLHIPSRILLILDGLWCILGIMILIHWRKIYTASVPVKVLLAAVAAFLASTFVGLAFGYQSILYYLWGLRNNFSYFVFFFACVLFLKAEDLDGYMKCLDILFVINFLVTLYQFFVLGYEQDYLGGIFGVQGGCNRQTNVFMMIVVTYSMVCYLNQKEKAWVCLLKCGISLLIAAMAELKMFILEFAAIVVLAVLLTKFSRRKIYLLIAGFVGALISIRLLTMIFPGWAGWFSLEKIWETATSAAGYNGHGVEVNRLTAIPIAWDTYLNTWPQKLFGLGLGHCDYSTLNFLVTPFYQQYGHILYTWFHSGFLMLETGLVGVVLYCSFFVVVFFAAYTVKRKNQVMEDYCVTVMILSAMCLLLFIYNDTLRCYAGYFINFVLAMPFVKASKQ